MICTGLTSGSDNAELFFIVNDQCPDHAWHPSAEGEKEDYEHGSASLVNYSQGRKYVQPGRGGYPLDLRFSIVGLRL